MLQDINRHKLAYSLLTLCAVVYLGLAYGLKDQPINLFFATVGFGLIYFFWGVLHHISTHSLTKRVVLEYLLVTALGIVIMSTLLL